MKRAYNCRGEDHEELTTDPCRAEHTSSGPRALAFVLLFVVMIGSVILALQGSFLLTLFAAIAGYTACVMVYGFARNRGGNPPYLFRCPVVISQYPRLLKRHLVFLILLICCVILALKTKPRPTERIATPHRDDTFYVLVAIPIAVLALTEVMTNRRVLERAHNDHFGEPPVENDPRNSDRISRFGDN